MLTVTDNGVEEIQNSGQICHMGLDCLDGCGSTLVRVIILCDAIANRKTHSNNSYGAARKRERFYHVERW